jgi:alpha-glucuronidase
VAAVDDQRLQWAALRTDIDPTRHVEIASTLAVQAREARWWRDACIAYFQSVSGLPLPTGVRSPEQTLAAYKALRFNFAPGRGG